uniref:Uncharacterized protein n=1 Tax=Strigamia maritima TaxID=126957 RepID=T1JE35_STRMM
MPGLVRLASRISRAGWIHQDQYAGVRMLGLKRRGWYAGVETTGLVRRGWYAGVGTLGYAGICRAKESVSCQCRYKSNSLRPVLHLLFKLPGIGARPFASSSPSNVIRPRDRGNCERRAGAAVSQLSGERHRSEQQRDDRSRITIRLFPRIQIKRVIINVNP